MEELDESGGPVNPVLARQMKRLMREKGIPGPGALRTRMVEAGFTIGTSSIYRAINGQGGNRLQTLNKLAQFFDVATDQLIQEQDSEPGQPGYRLDNVRVPQRGHSLPLISWVQAGSWSEIQDNFHPGDAEEWIPVYVAVGRHAFVLRVVGDSMTHPAPGPGQRTFPEGTMLIVDPDRDAGPGSYVIAKDVATQKATFKQLMSDGGRWFLKPLNPAYPTIEIDDPNMRVIGKVVEAVLRQSL